MESGELPNGWIWLVGGAPASNRGIAGRLRNHHAADSRQRLPEIGFHMKKSVWGQGYANVINLKRILNGKQNVWKYQNGEEKSDSDGREKDV